MKLETAQMIDNRREIVAKIQELLKADPRSGVERLAFTVLMNVDEPIEEGITIYYRGGASKKICVTASSTAAMIKAVHEAVYGKMWS